MLPMVRDLEMVKDVITEALDLIDNIRGNHDYISTALTQEELSVIELEIEDNDAFLLHLESSLNKLSLDIADLIKEYQKGDSLSLPFDQHVGNDNPTQEGQKDHER